MALPDSIEIVPLTGPLQARVTIPGSKSITNRALILASLSGGGTTLRGALWSEDTQVMVDCLQKLGFEVTVAPDPAESGNRVVHVQGLEGRIPPGGTAERPLELFVGNAGTAARFLTAMLCLGEGVYWLHGVPRMHERPQAGLLSALRQLGYRLISPNNRLPVMVIGGGPMPGKCQVSIEESSQFASALLLCARRGGWIVEIAGGNKDEAPYVQMTRDLIACFPSRGGVFQIEPDASSGSYFVAADWLLKRATGGEGSPTLDVDGGVGSSSGLVVQDWPTSDWQIDSSFPKYLPLPPEISRERDLGDSIMTAIVLAPFGQEPVRFTDLARLRLQECERVRALQIELGKCGVRVVEEGDCLTVHPSLVHGAEIETYHDHRIAMCFSILGLKVPGIKIKNPACVKKTFPSFFQKLAAPPPYGLGAKILHGTTGDRLEAAVLAAE